MEENPYRSPDSLANDDADDDDGVRAKRMSSAIAVACVIVVVNLAGLGVGQITSGGPGGLPLKLAVWCVINSITWSFTAWAVWKNRKLAVVAALSLDVAAFLSGFCFFPENR